MRTLLTILIKFLCQLSKASTKKKLRQTTDMKPWMLTHPKQHHISTYIAYEPPCRDQPIWHSHNGPVTPSIPVTSWQCPYHLLRDQDQNYINVETIKSCSTTTYCSTNNKIKQILELSAISANREHHQGRAELFFDTYYH